MMNPNFRRPSRNRPAKTPGQSAFTDGRYGAYGSGTPAATGGRLGRHLQPLATNSRKDRGLNHGHDAVDGVGERTGAGLPWMPNKASLATTASNPERRVMSRHLAAGSTAAGGGVGAPMNGHMHSQLLLPNRQQQQQQAHGGADRFHRAHRGQPSACDLKFEVWNFASPAPPPAAAVDRPRSQTEHSRPYDADESQRAVSLPEVGSGAMTISQPSPLAIDDSAEDDDEQDSGDVLGEVQDEDDDVVLDADGDGNSSDEGEGDLEDAAAGSDSTASASRHGEGSAGGEPRRRRRKLLLEFPSISDEFGLFPATVMQEHAIIDTRLALAQQKTLHGFESLANPDLCAGVDNAVRSFAIRGPLDLALLEKALLQEVARQPVLRLVFYQYRDQLFCRAAKEVPEFCLERQLTGKASEAINDARRRPFPVQLYPIDREELEREELTVEAVTSEEDGTGAAGGSMHSQKLGMLLEEEGGGGGGFAGGVAKGLLNVPSAASKHALRKNSALRRSATDNTPSPMSIVDLDDVQVPTATKARRIGSALKRRSSSIIHLSRTDSLNDIAEQKTNGPLSSQNIPSLMSVSRMGSEKSILDSSGDLKQSKPNLSSPRDVARSPSGLGEPDARVESKLWLRAKVFSTSAQEHLLVFSAPAFISDFWSLSMLMIGVCNAYSALEKRAVDEKRASSMPSRKTSRAPRAHRQSHLQQILNLSSNSHQPPRQQQHSLQDHYNKTAATRAIGSGPGGPVCEAVCFQEIALREAETLQHRSRAKLWELWEGQATLTVLTRHGKKKVKSAPVLQLPAHVRGETARRTALIRSARTRTGACAVGRTFTSFKFLKLDETVTERFQRTLPASAWQRISADNPLYLMSLGLFVVLMARCCRGWNGSASGSGGQQGAQTSSGARLGTLSEAAPSQSAFAAGRREGMRPPSSRLHQQQQQQQHLQGQRRFQNAAPPGAGYFLIGVPMYVRDLSPSQMATAFGPMTNEACLKIMLPSYKTFCDLLLGLERSLKATRKQVHFPFSSICDELGIRGGLPVGFSFLRRREVQCLTNPEGFYFTETAVGVPGQGLARFGNQCYLQPENGQLKDHCHIELLLWEMLENESVRGGFRFQPQHIRPGYVDGLSTELTRLAEVVAGNPNVPLQELAESIRPPFMHRRGAERQPSASYRHR